MNKEGEEKWTKNTPLWYASVQGERGCLISHPYILGSVAQEVTVNSLSPGCSIFELVCGELY